MCILMKLSRLLDGQVCGCINVVMYSASERVLLQVKCSIGIDVDEYWQIGLVYWIDGYMILTRHEVNGCIL